MFHYYFIPTTINVLKSIFLYKKQKDILKKRKFIFLTLCRLKNVESCWMKLSQWKPTLPFLLRIFLKYTSRNIWCENTPYLLLQWHGHIMSYISSRKWIHVCTLALIAICVWDLWDTKHANCCIAHPLLLHNGSKIVFKTHFDFWKHVQSTPSPRITQFPLTQISTNADFSFCTH